MPRSSPANTPATGAAPANNWPELAAGLQNAGADAILIATNTMHKVAEQVQAAIDVPLLHIGDVVADALLAAGVHRAGLLGTRYTMEQPFS